VRSYEKRGCEMKKSSDKCYSPGEDIYYFNEYGAIVRGTIGFSQSWLETDPNCYISEVKNFISCKDLFFSVAAAKESRGMNKRFSKWELLKMLFNFGGVK